MRALILRPGAEAEVEEAFRWYEERDPGLGAEFLRMVDAALSGIRSHPKQYPQVHKAARQVVLRRFPFSLYFIIQPDESIEVISFFHGRRNPRRRRSRA